MTALTKRRFLCASAGLAYGLVLAAWGQYLADRSRLNLPPALATSPA